MSPDARTFLFDTIGAAVVSIAGKIGATPHQTLRNWVLQHGRDSGQREGVSCAESTRS